MTTAEPIGRRERKKAATRKAISDIATVMFVQRGFDNVSVREVADAADVSPTTVFAHFPQKEALVFDEDDEQRDHLVAAVRDRASGVSIGQALHNFYRAEIAQNMVEHGDDVSRRFMEFLNETPALRDYAAKMWLRHEDALADAIADELALPSPTPEVRAYARFVMQMQMLVGGSDDQLAALDAGFAVLEHGWAPIERQLGAQFGRHSVTEETERAVKLDGGMLSLFPPEASQFLRDLAANNTREQFTTNRPIYDRAIRGPLEDLTASAQEKYGPGKVMRPNRDVRFSNDKSPYRTDASMWAGSVGGVYLRLSATGIEAGGGLYEPTRDQLARAREAIAFQPLAATQLAATLSDLRSSGYREAGPALTTAPKGYDRNDPNIELLRLKHYAAVKSLPVTASLADVQAAWSGIEALIAWSEQYIGPALSWP